MIDMARYSYSCGKEDVIRILRSHYMRYESQKLFPCLHFTMKCHKCLKMSYSINVVTQLIKYHLITSKSHRNDLYMWQINLILLFNRQLWAFVGVMEQYLLPRLA